MSRCGQRCRWAGAWNERAPDSDGGAAGDAGRGGQFG